MAGTPTTADRDKARLISAGAAVRMLRAALVAAVLVPVLLFAVAAWQSRKQELAKLDLTAQKTADMLREHALKVFETHELVLARVMDRIRGLDWGTIRSSREVHDFLV